MYIFEAALEYFISILVSGAYLAMVTVELGISDSLTGILTAFVSLGSGFQIFAIFLANRKSVKRWVTILHSLNQLFFALIYVVPIIPLNSKQKIIVFIIFLLLGYIINNIVNSPKINWFMSLVDDQKRGRFTANKEIVSLISGMLFSLVIGIIIDNYTAIGDKLSAFIFCGIGIFVLMILHTLTLLFSKEKVDENKETIPIKQLLKELVRDKKLFKVVFISVLWSMANCATTPFYGTYQIKELGFSMTFVSLLSVVYAICRSLFSKPLGVIADRYSFAKMLNICFIVMLFSFGLNVFTVPANGKLFFTIHYILYAIGMAGINSATINLIYDYVNKEKRVMALAFSNTLAGVAGFLTTAILGKVVDLIQKNNNYFFGLNVYAQQVVSLIGVIIVVLTLIYLNTVIKKMQ